MAFTTAVILLQPELVILTGVIAPFAPFVVVIIMIAGSLMLQDPLPPGPIDQEWIIRVLAGVLLAVVTAGARYIIKQQDTMMEREVKRGDGFQADNKAVVSLMGEQTGAVRELKDATKLLFDEVRAGNREMHQRFDDISETKRGR